ncbi:30S ribosomal protein S8 [Candidatus Woesearchaeota archaeon]|nr:30S ribosomal protein S8 [Candidatus Woesearchaeota archaeon]
MTLNDNLADVFSQIMNAERRGKSKVLVKGSKLIKECLTIMKQHNYIGEFKETKTQQGDLIEVMLNGDINECNVIKPRFSVGRDEFEKFEKRFLPAKDFGILIVSTSKGLMTHIQAREKNLGGRLIAYCY